MDKTIKIVVSVFLVLIIGGVILFISPLLESASPAALGNMISDSGKISVSFMVKSVPIAIT